MGLSSSVVVILLVQWCLVGGVTGWLFGRLARVLLNRRTRTGTDLAIGACGAIVGAFLSGWFNEKRPAVHVGPALLRDTGQFIAEHQTLVAVSTAALLVLVSNSIIARFSRRPE
jgi:uncharacterized membrane protein YeaQ/YmgE (transglycosylase-associated protein family)